MKPFTFSRTPVLHHGEGMIKMIGTSLVPYQGNVLLVTGKKSFETSAAYPDIMDEFSRRKLTVIRCSIDHEPSPAMVDAAVSTFAEHSPEVVIAVGGGSVVDGAKAIAAMITLGTSVKDYLEVVGTQTHPGTRLPFIALPTTSGTGSEATRNAVLSEVGPQGFKRSLRHVNFVPDIAILDPLLTLNCPQSVTAYSGMDAFTQLLESYLSTAGNPITDALAEQGLKLVSQSLMEAYRDGSNIEARMEMSLAAYLSGITLANAGLGTVHGLAGIVGGLKNIPHGVICSRLMGPANAITVRKLRKAANSDSALSKYVKAGQLFVKVSNRSGSYYIDAFLDIIQLWTTSMGIPTLQQYGVSDDDLRQFARLGDNKNNPVQLKEEERYELLYLAWK
jgi:alcohol dehydrogenase class IV